MKIKLKEISQDFFEIVNYFIYNHHLDTETSLLILSDIFCYDKTNSILYTGVDALNYLPLSKVKELNNVYPELISKLNEKFILEDEPNKLLTIIGRLDKEITALKTEVLRLNTESP